MKKTNELNVKGTAVRVVKIDGEDFVCLTDMAKSKSDDAQQTISNWMRNRMTIEYLGLWEYLYNPSFKPLEFEGFRKELFSAIIRFLSIYSNSPAALRSSLCRVFYQSSFDGISNSVAEAHVEFWYARDLMGLLGYTRWENFAEAIKRAETSCSSNNIDISYHFRDVTKMINLPKGAKREIADVMLSRYAWQADLQGEAAITDEHVTNNTTVREMLGKRGIVPENLPPAPDIKKLERSVRRQDKVIADQKSAHLPPPENYV